MLLLNCACHRIRRCNLARRTGRDCNLRQTEVQNLGVATLGHENIGGLDVAVNDALRVRGIQCVRDLDRQTQQNIGFNGFSGDAMLQRHAIQKLHGDEWAAHLARRFHGWCRCWDGSGQKQLRLLAGNGPVLAGPWPLHQAETSARRIDVELGPRPCKPHPCRHHRASQRCGNARWFGRSFARMLWRVVVQVNEFGDGYFSFAYSALASFRMGMSGSASFRGRRSVRVISLLR